MGADTREGVSVHCEKCQSNSAKRLAPPSRGPVGQAYVPVDSSHVMGNVGGSECCDIFVSGA